MINRVLKHSFRPLLLRRCFADATAPQSQGLTAFKAKADVSHSPKMQYIDNELVPVNYLVLRTRQSIEEYVLKTIKDYFRTTNRATLTMNSELSAHGLDSLDAIEIAMTIESDLGYLIASENLPAFVKPVHYVNYIEHVENFKVQHGKDPMP